MCSALASFMAAAYDIKRHFSGLRVQTARRRGRDPFATGFEDESDEERKSRTRTKAPVANKPAPVESSPFANIDALKQDTDDDDFLNFVPTTAKADKKSDRRPSPSPASITALRGNNADSQARRGSLPGVLPGDPKKAAVLASGPLLAYLDDSSEDEGPTRRRNRRPSPAPSADHRDRSQTPAGEGFNRSRDQVGLKPNAFVPKHTVASPFAGTVCPQAPRYWRCFVIT